jgi:uncharacterized protein (TIGR02757 family)
MKITAQQLEKLYERYNRREYVNPDPLQFLYAYPNVRDREIVGLVASGLAYGRVKQILKSVHIVLERMEQPAEFVRRKSLKEIRRTYNDFKHRFTTGEEIANMLFGIKMMIDTFGSLEAGFLAGYDEGEETTCQATREFSRRLMSPSDGRRTSLLPLPTGKGAFKRMNLYLRWMVRNDAVDPGGWNGVSPGKLVIPLDTHMYRIGIDAGFTHRKSADMQTALEITSALKQFSPEDAVKYDFALTRPGIRKGIDFKIENQNEKECECP